MSSRRHFLQTAAAASLIPFAAPVSLAATDTGATIRPRLMVAETRWAAAAAFATEAGMRGIPVRAIDGDVTSLWYNELHALWRARPVPIAGLTARPALFCLEQLAWDHGMRVVYHAEHRQHAVDTCTHLVLMPIRGLSTAALDAQAEHWSGHVASVLARPDAASAVPRAPAPPAWPSRWSRRMKRHT